MMNDLPPQLKQRPANLPWIARIAGGLFTVLLLALILLAIVAAGWAILYLIHTAP